MQKFPGLLHAFQPVDGSSPQAPARRKRLTAKNQTRERMATSRSASNHGAGRAQPTTTLAPAPMTMARRAPQPAPETAGEPVVRHRINVAIGRF